MLTTTRKPATVGEILIEEFMKPLGLSQAALAEAMGVRRRQAAELCDGGRITAETAHVLARVFGTRPSYWLQAQMHVDLWEALRDPERSARIDQAKRLGEQEPPTGKIESGASRFEVLRRVDAYVDYIADVEAESAKQAAELAEENEDAYDWRPAGTQEFDDRKFFALDENGCEIDETECGDF